MFGLPSCYDRNNERGFTELLCCNHRLTVTLDTALKTNLNFLFELKGKEQTHECVRLDI